MNSEKDFLIARDNHLNIKLGNYRNKIETLRGIVEIKEDLLGVIDRVLPKDYTDRIVNKAHGEDAIQKQMKVLEHNQSLLRKKVKDILNPKTLKAENTKRLVVDRKQGRVSGE